MQGAVKSLAACCSSRHELKLNPEAVVVHHMQAAGVLAIDAVVFFYELFTNWGSKGLSGGHL